MSKENIALLFGEFPGISANVTDGTEDRCGVELNWETQDTTTIINISASEKSISMVLNDSTSFSLGNNSDGQLGIGSTLNANTFSKVITDKKLTNVQCGNKFTVWLSEEQEILISGYGFQNTPQNFDDNFAKRISVYNTKLAIIDLSGIIKIWNNLIENRTPIVISLPSIPKDISCCDSFSLARSKGAVFKIEVEGSFSPIITSTLSSEIPRKVKQIKCAANYGLMLDDKSFCWLHGQVGNMTRKNNSPPIAQDMREIFAMPNHCAFVSNIGTTFVFGENQHGQLGDGTIIKRTRAIELSLNNPTIYVVGGSTYTVFVSNQFDSSLFKLDMNEFIPGFISCPFEKAEDMIDANSSP